MKIIKCSLVLIALITNCSVIGQTNGIMTGNLMFAKVISETNIIPLNLYPLGYFDELELYWDIPLPIIDPRGPRPTRPEPEPTLEVRGGGMTMNGITRIGPIPTTPDYDYYVVDLGKLDGSSQSSAWGINNKGQVVGHSSSAFLWDSGVMYNLGGSEARGINEKSQIVGITTLVSPYNVGHAFLITDGVMHDLSTANPTYTSYGYGINNPGQCVGVEYIGSDTHPILFSGGNMQDLGSLGGNAGAANAIDDYGDIVGLSRLANGNVHGFLYDGTTMNDIGTLGGNYCEALGIDVYAEITGRSTLSSGSVHAFFYDGTMQDLGVLPGTPDNQGSVGYGININASTVGTSGGRAFLYSNGSMKDLNNLLVNGTGWVLGVGLAINDHDQIVGQGTYNGQIRGFLLNPLTPGSLQAAQNMTPSQTGLGTLPVKDSGKDSLIVITHGWYSTVDPGNVYPFSPPNLTWMDNMSNNIRSSLVSRGINNWQIYCYKWINNAWRYHPMDALNGAATEGKNLGKSIVSQGWTHVHLISHSAGAALIQNATDVIKDINLGAPSTVVHETFLDPFVGVNFAGITTYGRGANWADQYFARDKLTEADPFDASLFSVSPYTESPVYHSYNVDVTALDVLHKRSHIKFASSPNGAQIAETCNVTETSHGWPIDFYTNSIIASASSDYQGFGFPLSEEGGNWSATPGYLAGNGTDINPTSPLKTLGVPDSACTLVGTLSPPVYPNTVPDYTQLPSIQSTTGTIQKYIDHLNLLSGSSAWISTVVTVTNPVNFIAFDAAFTSSVGAQGVFTILWDTDVIGVLDERLIDHSFQHYQLSFPNTASYAPHVLGLRLDPFTNIQSAITLTNIVFNQVGVSQLPTLSTTTNTVSGLRVWRLDGQAGFNYNVQAISDLSNPDWADIATLANTNGTVFFYDQDQNSFPQRFYRTSAP
jgi:probable HAF family extracellular repeat protein